MTEPNDQSPEMVTLSIPSELTVRETDEGGAKGRRVSGIVVPWGVPTVINRGRSLEMFAAGAFDKTLTERTAPVPLLAQHDRSQPIGRMIGTRNTPDGQWMEFELVEGVQRSDEALALIKAGVWSSFSVGFIPLPSRTEEIRDDQGVTTYVRREVKLDHVGVLHDPAYEDAKILAVRESDPVRDEAAVIRARARKRRRSYRGY